MNELIGLTPEAARGICPLSKHIVLFSLNGCNSLLDKYQITIISPIMVIISFCIYLYLKKRNWKTIKNLNYVFLIFATGFLILFIYLLFSVDLKYLFDKYLKTIVYASSTIVTGPSSSVSIFI